MTAAMLIAYSAAPRAMPDPMPLAITSGIVSQVFGLARTTAPVIVLGILIQFLYGAIWGGLLAVSTRTVTIGKGIAVGVGLWLIMVIFYIPMAGTMAFTVAGNPMMWVMTLLFHIIYGGTLGYLLHRHPMRVHEAESLA